MSLFRVNKVALEAVGEKPFGKERELQALTEANLNTLFGLEFISTEFERNGLRIDTLAYDPEGKSFAIIEYKRSQSSGVVDQGFSYLSLMLNNKAEFVLEYNQKKKDSKNKSDFDWSQVRIIFLARSFTVHQQNAINFKNMPFELWEVVRFENDLLQYRQIETSNSTESLEHIRNIGAETEKVTKEVKKYSEEDLMGNDGVAHDLYVALRDGLAQSAPELIPRPKKMYIGFHYSDNWRNVINVGRIRNGIVVHFTRSKPEQFDDPQRKLKAMERARDYYNQDVTILEVRNEKDIRYALLIIQQAYERFVKEFVG